MVNTKYVNTECLPWKQFQQKYFILLPQFILISKNQKEASIVGNWNHFLQILTDV